MEANETQARHLLEYQNDDYLKAIAEYFASQKPPFLPRHPPPASSAVLAHGEALATQGDASRGIPACASCHNPPSPGWNRVSQLWSDCRPTNQCATWRLPLWDAHCHHAGLFGS